MPWEGDVYQGYIPLAALRERDPAEIVVMQVQYQGTKAEGIYRPPEAGTRSVGAAPIVVDVTDPRRFTTWLNWFEHGTSVGALIRLLTTEPGVRPGKRRQRTGSIAEVFEGRADLIARGGRDLERAIQFRIKVIGTMGEGGGWPRT